MKSITDTRELLSCGEASKDREHLYHRNERGGIVLSKSKIQFPLHIELHKEVHELQFHIGNRSERKIETRCYMCRLIIYVPKVFQPSWK